MKRVAFRMRIKPGCEQIYEEKHADIWPELAESIQRGGTSNYSIFRDGLDLFAYLESNSELPPDAPVEEIVLKWWRLMEPYMEYNEDHTPKVWPISEVFHLD